MYTLIRKALLNPEAKKPPNGATKLANIEKTIECNWNLVTSNVDPNSNCRHPGVSISYGIKYSGISHSSYLNGVSTKLSAGHKT